MTNNVSTSVMTQKRSITRAECIPSFSRPGEPISALFRPQRDHGKMYAARVIVLFCVIADKTQNNTRYDFEVLEKGGKKHVSLFNKNHNKELGQRLPPGGVQTQSRGT